jgi:integrase
MLRGGLMETAIQRKSTDELFEMVRNFQDASISPASRRAYRSDWQTFIHFCDFRAVDALPATGETISLFLTELADLKKSVSTIVRSLTSINKAHELAGFGSVRTPQIKALMKGIKRTIGRPADKVKGITYKEILQMAAACDSSLLGVRDRAILMLGWTSALRRSELVALNIGDLEISERGIILTVARSKTDQDGEGKKIAIPRARKKTNCPVLCVERWLARLSEDDRAPDKPLFSSVGTAGQRFWSNVVYGRLSDRMISYTVKRYAHICGFPPDKYASHSLRRGLATEAGSRRIPERIIARHTRHLSIAVLREYIESGNIWDENPLTGIYPTSSSDLITHFDE